MKELAGFREIEHTADWELQVWAPEFAGLLEQAALGMLALSGTRLAQAPRIQRNLDLHADDAESLLVSFLSELNYIAGVENIAFDRYRLILNGFDLHGEMDGAPVASIDKEIKAVTYHNLALQQFADGLRVNIVFDV